MKPCFYSITASPKEEEQNVAKFLKILSSLGEHALSILQQKGVIPDDKNYEDYQRRLSNDDYRNSIINSLLRSTDHEPDKDTQCLVAILLFNMSIEAQQLFSETLPLSNQTGSNSRIIALSQLIALIDRATAFLNLPSVNDKAYWRLMTLQPPTNSHPVQSPPVIQPPGPEQSATQTKPPVIAKRTVQTAPPSPSPHAKKTSAAPPPPKVPSAVPELSPIRAVKRATKSKSASSVKNANITAANYKSNIDTATPAERESNKPEGPIKAALRRIAEEIHDNSYEAILEALKDDTLMKDLYTTADNPISVKITGVNAKERVVYMIKQKRGAPEPVTFRLIRKLVTEL